MNNTTSRTFKVIRGLKRKKPVYDVSVYSGAKSIDAYIERRRAEYHKEWFEYISENSEKL